MTRIRFGAIAVAICSMVAASTGGFSAASADPAMSSGDSPPPLLSGMIPAEDALESTRLVAQVAEAAGVDVQHTRSLLQSDGSLWVTPKGELVFLDPGVPGFSDGDAGTTSNAQTALTQSEAFSRHSRPDARRVLYLDFDGYQLPAGSAWYGGQPFAALPYDSDGNPGQFTAAELAMVDDVWQRVSEHYAAFDIDVTTQDMGDDAIRRSAVDDDRFGGRVVITNSPYAGFCSRCAGVSFVGTVDALASEHDRLQPSWVFANFTGGNAHGIASVVSHEFGHLMGLSHDGQLPSTEYYSGHGLWAPFMGTGYTQPILQWSKGEYSGATQHEDDFAVAGAHGIRLAPDDAGDSTNPRDVLIPGRRQTVGPVADVDTWRFSPACTGTYTLTAAPTSPGPSVSLDVALLDSSGSVLASDTTQPSRVFGTVATGLDGAVTRQLEAGRIYSLRVRGLPSGTASTGWTNYANSGHYSISVSQPNCQPSNDLISSAAQLGGQTSGLVSGSTIGATRAPSDPIPGPEASANVWFRFSPTETRSYRFRVCDASFDPVIGVYGGTDPTRLVPLASNDNSSMCGTAGGSAVDASLAAGNSYAIQVTGSRAGARGLFGLRWSIADGTSPEISVQAPLPGRVYEEGDPVPATYSCIDPESVVLSCVGTYESGFHFADLDMEGADETTFTLKVVAINEDHQATERSIPYSIRAPDPPSVNIQSPRYGQTIEEGAVVTADFTCTDDLSGVASCIGSTPVGAPLPTARPGALSFSVTAVDRAGWSSTFDTPYQIAPKAPPLIHIYTPRDGETLDTSSGTTAWFACEDAHSRVVECAGDVDSGDVLDLTPGDHALTVRSKDEWGNISSRTVHYSVEDRTPPRIERTTPERDAIYEFGTTVLADYACVDESTGSGTADCRGSAESGSPIDTSLLGLHQFEISSGDRAGNTANEVIWYEVEDTILPTIEIVTPVDGGTYEIDSEVTLDYSCDDGPRGSGIVHCSGPRRTGRKLDTTELGTFTFVVETMDENGNRAARSVTYEVVDTTAPTIVVSRPVESEAIPLRSTQRPRYACRDALSSGVRSCVLQGWDTSRIGLKEMTITAVDWAGNSSQLRRSYRVSRARPDVSARPADRSATVGGDIYGPGQVLTVDRCKRCSVVVTVQNDAAFPDRLTVKGLDVSSLYSVRYVSPTGVDISGQMRSGRFRTPLLPPGKEYAITIEVLARSSVPRAALDGTMTARSVTHGDISDWVRLRFDAGRT